MTARAGRRYRLAQQRKAVGFSQEQLAERLEVDRSTIVRWESGDTEPQPWARPKLAQALQVSVDQLAELLTEPWGIEAARYPYPIAPGGTTPQQHNLTASYTDRQGLAEIDDMNRRELLRLMTMAGTLMAVSGIEDGLDWERLDYFSSGMRPLDHATVDEYATLNNHLWRVFALSKTKGHAYPLVHEQLGVLINALQRAHGQAIHHELCAVVADLFQLAGEILFDGNRYTDAAHCYTLAAAASKEAAAFDLWACALTRHAFVAVYEQQFAKAGPMLELAAGLARRGDRALSTRYWVSAVQAQTFAGLGDLDACQRALDEAGGVHQLHGEIHNVAGSALMVPASPKSEERVTWRFIAWT